MKKYIKADSELQYDYMTWQAPNGRKYSYSVYETPLNALSDINDYQAQVRESHPYDLQEYVGAFIGYTGRMVVQFRHNGKVVGRQNLELYDTDIDYANLGDVQRKETNKKTYPVTYEYEASEQENQQAYIDYCLALVMGMLREYNKDIPAKIDRT